MSKPLELTVYPRLGEGAHAGYAMPHVVIGTVGVDRRVQAKRLTDAELGSILWFHVSREAQAEVMGWHTGHAQDWINTNQEECRIVGILERFAKFPNYDEVA